MEYEELYQTNPEEQTYDLSSVKLPYIMKNKVLLAPGVWNDNYYDAKSIKEAFENTNWENKDIRALFLDHEDKRTSEWVGFVENPKLVGSKITGDLKIWDKDLAVKVGIAGMKCGISPKVKGHEDLKSKNMTDFIFENFSIVTNPACKTAYINLMEENKMAEEDENKEAPAEVEPESQPAEAPAEETKELAKKKKYPYPEEEMKKKKKKEEPEEELSDRGVTDMLSSLSVEELSAWTAFISKTKKAHPDWSFKKIAAEFKKKKKMSDELAELDEDEIIEKINALTEILKKKKYPYPEEEKKKKMEESIKKMSEKIEELNEKLNEPDKKSIKTLGAGTTPKVSADTAMWEFMKRGLN